jgi:hypothetical protein
MYTAKQKVDAIQEIIIRMLNEDIPVTTEAVRDALKQDYPDMTFDKGEVDALLAELEKRRLEAASTPATPTTKEDPLTTHLQALRFLVKRFGKEEVRRLVDLFD